MAATGMRLARRGASCTIVYHDVIPFYVRLDLDELFLLKCLVSRLTLPNS